MKLSLKYLTLFFAISLAFLSPALWAADEEAPQKKQPIYYSFSTPFIINFLHQSEHKIRYLQITVSLMSFNQDTITNAELNEPMLQDALRMLFAKQSMDTVTTVEGRVALQKIALELVKTLLKQETDNDDIEAIYFTSFILQ